MNLILMYTKNLQIKAKTAPNHQTKIEHKERLLKAQRIQPCNIRRERIKVLNHEIKVLYFAQKEG